jgi:hypothetical protein
VCRPENLLALHTAVSTVEKRYNTMAKFYRVAEVETSKQDRYVIVNAENEVDALLMGVELFEDGNTSWNLSEVYDYDTCLQVTEVKKP